MRAVVIGGKWVAEFPQSVAKALQREGIDTLFVPLYAKEPEVHLFEVVSKRWRCIKSKLIKYCDRGIIERQAVRAMIKEIARFEPHLILLSDTGIRSTTRVLKYFRKQNRCVIVQWLADLIDKFPFVHENLKYCDRFYVANPFEAARIKELKLCRTEYLPLACSPETERTLSLSAKDRAFYGSDVSFVGAVKKALVHRLDFFDELLNGDLDFGIKIWDAWGEDLIKTHPQFTKYVQTRRVLSLRRTRVYNASKINLNLQHEGIVGIGNLRFFGIPASGGFQICNKRDQAHLFEPYLEGLIKVTAFFNTIEEFRQLVRYYLQNEKERMEMAKEAQRIVHKKHTYGLRVRQIINDVGLT
jgi:hypothetical protein